MDKLWLKSMKFCSPTCHQNADRSFFIKNKQMPICSRCLGIYIGYIIGLIFMVLSYYTFQYLPMYVSFILIIPTLLDGTIQYFTSYESTNMRRLLTGIIAGVGIICFLGVFLLMIVGVL